ncbi:quinoprotein glucose dehydrogenase [Rubellimicrobium thermophilum DSM 16684]|uniref:Quinoprotein glucose dehydrogenase n=1 Tax=Rubellimicrobium thermophilum DSM 16684 TaxID=1123069 RepID=S9R703_9RHOB|nr:pyrroloquinoline quinone-dependent dehydrogenase [Rubellimicrobium thermophilum]EPX87657.1 quinoprotein glucose dehydrogenase [Rubellimicrobium thermophilum DSM 16684]
MTCSLLTLPLRSAALAALLAAPALAEQTTWTGFHGDLASTKFADVARFTPATVGNLVRAWEVRTGDVSDGSGDRPATVWSATPVYANGMLYLGTPFYRILALDPATGAEIWSYDSHSTLEALTQPALKNRGVAYWESGQQGPCEKRVYLGTMDAHLHAVDADTGALCPDFGEGGILDVNRWNRVNARFPFSLLQPPLVVGDRLYLGWAGKDWEYAVAPPGNLLALDARTGRLEWELSFIPEEMIPQTGTANIWTAMSADPELGLLYAPVSSPSPNYWGGNRTDPIPLATSVTAVDLETGEVVWSFQHVHHDIWDYDTPAAPQLVDIERDGQTIPALVQTTKQGFLYVLDRRTGEPLFPVEERPVPPSDAEGEVASPTQPFALTPPPTNDPFRMPGVWWLADLTSGGQCSRERETYRYEGIFTPPSEQGTFLYPGTAGANNWGGAAVDDRNDILYVNSMRVVQVLTLIPREEYDRIQGDSGNEEGYYPQEGAPYGIHLTEWRNALGLPCWEPPYGTFAAYDLRSGERLYEVPFGLSQQWGFYGLRDWGSPTLGGPVATAGGVIFIGASMDNRVRALDAATGRELWSDIVDAPVVANPAVFTHDGVDYVVFVAGGNSILKDEVSDQVVAYRLP